MTVRSPAITILLYSQHPRPGTKELPLAHRESTSRLRALHRSGCRGRLLAVKGRLSRHRRHQEPRARANIEDALSGLHRLALQGRVPLRDHVWGAVDGFELGGGVSVEQWPGRHDGLPSWRRVNGAQARRSIIRSDQRQGRRAAPRRHRCASSADAGGPPGSSPLPARTAAIQAAGLS